MSPAPSPQKPTNATNAQATQIQSKLPMGLPSGVSVSIKQTPRNNQQSLHQLPQQQPQQHPQSAVRSAAQTPPAVTIVPTQSNLTENAAVKSVAPAAAVAAAQNGQIGTISQNGKIEELEEEIGNLPIAMEIDETIGNGQTGFYSLVIFSLRTNSGCLLNGACSVHGWKGRKGVFRNENILVKMTSVCGHVMSLDFVGK